MTPMKSGRSLPRKQDRRNHPNMTFVAFEQFAFVDWEEIPLQWEESSVVFDAVDAQQQLTRTYPLSVPEVKETPCSLRRVQCMQTWRGITIVGMTPADKCIPMFNRPGLNLGIVPRAPDRTGQTFGVKHV